MYICKKCLKVFISLNEIEHFKSSINMENIGRYEITTKLCPSCDSPIIEELVDVNTDEELESLIINEIRAIHEKYCKKIGVEYNG